MEKQDTKIGGDGRSLGNLLITGELHVGTDYQSPHKKLFLNGKKKIM